VVTGKREIMMEMEEIFFSGTFGGELLSLAAAKAVLQLHINQEVVPQLRQIGTDLKDRLSLAISETNTDQLLSLSGDPTWVFLSWQGSENYSPEILKTYFLQEMFQLGVLILGTHNVNLAHTPKQLKKLEESYLTTLSSISKGVSQDNLESKIRVSPLKPLFKVR
jgi:4-aminobutyrate aminotransferase-like enzyme